MTTYLLLTRNQELLAKGCLQRQTPEGILQLKIEEGDASAVAEQEIVCLIGNNSEEKPMQCKVTGQQDRKIFLKKIMTLNPEMRRSYRIPASFESYIYPVSGGWFGRRKMKAVDMSCGGISFRSGPGLRVGETAQIVIPNIRFPVLVKIEILREEILSDGTVFYCSKFTDLCREEEASVCQSVFGIQIADRKNGTAKNYTI